MSQSLSKLLTHIIFSTKNRQPMLIQPIREPLKGYLIGTLEALQSPSIQLNCVEDHVHILCNLSRRLSLAELVEEIKKSSSKWLKTQHPSLTKFYWQAGYGAFSVSQSSVRSVTRYILDQESHHRRTTFQEEYRAFLNRHNVEFDERYLWD